MSCAVGHRHGSDATFLWLWLWLAAVALIRRLAWELPHAVGAALKKAKKKKKKSYQQSQDFNPLEFVLWCKSTRGVSAALGHRFHPLWHSGLRMGLQLQHGPQLQLRSDPWPRNSICHGAGGQAKMGGKKSPKPLILLFFHNLIFQNWGEAAELERGLAESRAFLHGEQLQSITKVNTLLTSMLLPSTQLLGPAFLWYKENCNYQVSK